MTLKVPVTAAPGQSGEREWKRRIAEALNRLVSEQSTTAGNVANGAWIPLTDGADPPNFILDGANNLILVWTEI